MVNTFIVADDPRECARLLDYRRLGKQRLESKQIILALEAKYEKETGADVKESKWANHPAVKMWDGYITGLRYYYNSMVDEWVKRGYNNTMKKYDMPEIKDYTLVLPWFFTCKQLQLSHKCSLLRKDPDYYSKIFPLTSEEKQYMQHGYVWPSNLTPEQVSTMKKGIFVVEAFSPIGAGAPAQYHISKSEVEKWLCNKNINPKSKRRISTDGTVYRTYIKAATYYGIDVK